MRLTQYINESDNIRDDFIEILNVNELSILIKRNCKPYLKLLKGRTPLFRGMEKMSNPVGIKKQRKDRTTKLMTKNLLTIVNKYLKEKNLPLRTESMICTSDENRARNFFGSNTYFVFPKDNFKFAMVRSSDINFSSSNFKWDVTELSHMAFKYSVEQDDEIYNKIISMLDYGLDGNSQKAFDEAYEKKYEMWFDCNEYYYVKVSDPMSSVVNRIRRGK